MDGKVGLLLGLGAGLVLGAGGMYATVGRIPDADVADAPVVVTQIVERAISVASSRPGRDNRPEPGAEAQPAPPGEEGTTVAFQAGAPPTPGDAPPGEQRRQRTEEEWRAEWTQRQARFMAEWTNRAVAARTNFIASAKLNEEQATRFDVLLTAMNVRLASILDPVMAKYQQGIRPSSEERARLTHDVSGALVTTYDEMNRSMPEGWGDIASSNNVSLSQFVDPKYLPFMRGVGGGGRPDWGGRRGGGEGGGGPVGAPAPRPPQ